MSENNVDSVPAGFEQIPPLNAFTDNLQPIYRRLEEGRVSIGLLVAAQHGNTMGICHGGVLMTLADIAAATGVNVARGTLAGAPTINLSVDFINAARMGCWIQADVDRVTLKRRFGFCSGVISSNTDLIARFNGTFYLPEHKGMVKDEAPGDGVPGKLI